MPSVIWRLSRHCDQSRGGPAALRTPSIVTQAKRDSPAIRK